MNTTVWRVSALVLATTLAIGCGTSEPASGGTDGGASDDGAGGGATDGGGTDAAAGTDSSSGGGGSDGSGSGSDAGPSDAGGQVAEPCTDEEAKAACDDGLSCTKDTCTKVGDTTTCAWALEAGFCLIGKVCYAADAAHPKGLCKVCDPGAAKHAWSQAKAGASCEDGVTCTVDGACDDKGACQGKQLDCDDGNPCTKDTCVQGQGCVYPPIAPGLEIGCTDDNACTKGDACEEGVCLGTPVACDDGNPCTTDACDLAAGCTHTESSDACDDGDACTAGDTCAEGACKSSGKTNCDDGNACTIDICDKAAGCAWLPTESPCCKGDKSICDDGKPCTTDLCDPKTGGCKQEDNTALCDDGDACTTGDVCAKGSCGGKAKGCDDKNPCTTDACDKSKGCVHAPTNDNKPCDDVDPCSKNETCQQGVCKGTGGCACTPKFGKVAAKVTDLKVGKGGQPGEGLDLDGDPKTCAPSSSCTAGIDNALGALAGLVNGQLDKPVKEGSILLLVEFVEFKQGAVKLAIHQGALDASNKTCDFQKKTCKYTADTGLIDPVTCAPKAALDGKLVGKKLTAGGKGTTFPFALPLQDGVNLNLTLYDLQLVGTVESKGGSLTGMTAVLGGAVLKTDLEKAIDALPDEGLPVPKATIKALLASTVEKDIDVDGDGKAEASSIALKIVGIPAVITGAK